MIFTHNNNEYELILLHLAGSKLYGNSTPESDTDFRGIFIAPKETKLGILGTVEQLEGIDVCKSLQKAGLDIETTSDCVIYELNRFVKLAAENNPNIIDTLCMDYTNPEFAVYVSDKGKELLDSKHLFLSSKLKFTFSGYAISQLQKVRSRDKYLTKFPDISKVLARIVESYDRKLIDWNWICDNFGGSVAEFVCTDETPQNNVKLNDCIDWDAFLNLNSDIEDLNSYRRPQLISYCHIKDLKGKQLDINDYTTNLFSELFYLKTDDMKFSKFLYNSASFRTFSPSMLAIYSDGNGIFTKEGKLKANDPEHIGEFVCLLSIDQNKYKSDCDFNQAMWEWKCKRNEKRSALEAEFGVDLKNLSHLWRLMTKAKEILATGEYNPTLEGEDLKTLKGIRDGSLYGKGSYDFAIKFAEENDKELDELYKTTKLQKKPDIKKINELVLKLQEI